MDWKLALRSAVSAGRHAASEAIERAEHIMRMMRIVQALLITALVILVATVAVGLAQPGWLPYTFAVGTLILAIPLVGVLVILWAPLHSRPAKIVHELAHH